MNVTEQYEKLALEAKAAEDKATGSGKPVDWRAAAGAHLVARRMAVACGDASKVDFHHGAARAAISKVDAQNPLEAGESGHLVDKDGEKHLPTHKDGKPDHRLMGAAWAALHGGFRGNKYEGPDKEAAITKLKKLYKAEGLTTPAEAKDATESAALEAAGTSEGAKKGWESRMHHGGIVSNPEPGHYTSYNITAIHPNGSPTSTQVGGEFSRKEAAERILGWHKAGIERHEGKRVGYGGEAPVEHAYIHANHDESTHHYDMSNPKHVKDLEKMASGGKAKAGSATSPADQPLEASGTSEGVRKSWETRRAGIDAVKAESENAHKVSGEAESRSYEAGAGGGFAHHHETAADFHSDAATAHEKAARNYEPGSTMRRMHEAKEQYHRTMVGHHEQTAEKIDKTEGDMNGKSAQPDETALQAAATTRLQANAPLQAKLKDGGYSYNDFVQQVQERLKQFPALTQGGNGCLCPWVADVVCPTHEQGETWTAVVRGADQKLYAVTFTIGGQDVTLVGEPRQVEQETDYDYVTDPTKVSPTSAKAGDVAAGKLALEAAGISEGVRKAWQTRKGGMPAMKEYDMNAAGRRGELHVRANAMTKESVKDEEAYNHSPKEMSTIHEFAEILHQKAAAANAHDPDLKSYHQSMASFHGEQKHYHLGTSGAAGKTRVANDASKTADKATEDSLPEAHHKDFSYHYDASNKHTDAADAHEDAMKAYPADSAMHQMHKIKARGHRAMADHHADLAEKFDVDAKNSKKNASLK